MGKRSILNSQRVLSLPCGAGQTQPQPLPLTLTGWKGNEKPAQSSQSTSCKLLITGFGCLPQLVNGDEMEQDQTTAGYIFLRCIALAPSLPLLTGFLVQSLLAASLLQVASMEYVLGTSSGTYTNKWKSKAESPTDVF